MSQKGDMEEDEGKSDFASGGLSFTEEDEKLVNAFHALNLSPHVESPSDLVNFLTKFGSVLYSRDKDSNTPKPTGYPRLSLFYGEDGKGETSWETFLYEIEALISDKVFSHDQILLGIRRAVKGTAADIMRRLGPGISLEACLQKFRSTYGSIASEETVLRNFYSCQQRPKETITSYASRLEEIHTQAVSLNALYQDDSVLKKVLYHGLSSDIKHMAAYKYDTIVDYDKFKIELRKIEADLSYNEPSKLCHAQVPVEKKPSELDEVKALLLKLHERIDVLENKQEHHGNGSIKGRNHNSYQGKGRGSFKEGNNNNNNNNTDQRRPLGSQNFQPTCYGCNGKGHMIKDCPNPRQRQCYNCKNFGHIAKDCPNE